MKVYFTPRLLFFGFLPPPRAMCLPNECYWRKASFFLSSLFFSSIWDSVHDSFDTFSGRIRPSYGSELCTDFERKWFCIAHGSWKGEEKKFFSNPKRVTWNIPIFSWFVVRMKDKFDCQSFQFVENFRSNVRKVKYFWNRKFFYIENEWIILK